VWILRGATLASSIAVIALLTLLRDLETRAEATYFEQLGRLVRQVGRARRALGDGRSDEPAQRFSNTAIS
jgi:hypothetical protein